MLIAQIPHNQKCSALENRFKYMHAFEITVIYGNGIERKAREQQKQRRRTQETKTGQTLSLQLNKDGEKKTVKSS